MFTRKLKNKKGFTLIELLVVIAIIAILVILIIMALAAARRKARDSSRKTDLRTVQTGLELANDTLGNYPVEAGYGALIVYADAGEDPMGLENEMPTDPVAGNAPQYGYAATAVSGLDYMLGAKLESVEEGHSDDNCPVANVNGHTYCVGSGPILDPVV